jgi:hypothetical protein
MKFNKLILSRYLYFLDDLFFSLEKSILIKNTFYEVLFWLSELYYSEFYDLIWIFIFTTYYNYYYFNNSQIEYKLYKLYYEFINNNNENEKIKIIIYTIKNLYIRKHCKTIYNEYSKLTNIKYIIYYYLEKHNINLINIKHNIKKHRNKINNNKLLDSFIQNNKLILNNEKKQIIVSLINNRNIYNYIDLVIYNDLSNNKKLSIIELYNLIIKYYKEKDYFKNFDFINNNNFKFNIYIYKIISLLNNNNNNNNNNKKIFVSPTKKEINYFINTNKKTDFIFDTLKEKRLFKIHNNNFMNKEKKYIQTYGLWEYYIFDTPLWIKRIKKYNIIKNSNYKLMCNINNETYNMIYFKDDPEDNKKYLFNDLFNYELEEQKLEIRNMAL